jgi:sigma-B regulation protein RsbU (phosphoserine phosphatase)
MSLVESQNVLFDRGGRQRAGGKVELRKSAVAPTPIATRALHSPFDLHAVSIPAGSFTGDFYFARQFDHEIWIALGDVAGKGLEAAIFMAMIHEELETRIDSCSRHGCDPSTTMSRLDGVLRDTLPANRFATAVVARISDDGTLRLSNGGHCPSLLLRADGSIEELASTGPALGILCQPQWRTTTTRLQHGDTLFLYTDGLIEAQPAGVEDELGLLCARSELQALVDRSARDITASFRDLVLRHSRGNRYDDLTLLAVRFNGSSTRDVNRAGAR